MTHPLDRELLRARVQSAIEDQLALAETRLAEIGEDLSALTDPIGRLLGGGKRLRAAFAYWGYRSAGHPDSDEAVRLATSMEFFQAAALLHDDVMDRSDTRRGMPSAHRAAADLHTSSGWRGDARRFGDATAILAGDLCLVWTDDVFAACGLPEAQLRRARPVFDRMRTQLMGGQFLDVQVATRDWAALDTEQRLATARRVIRYKSAKYTIEHPLLVGAQAGGLDEADCRALSTYGLALGEAFQLRDDLLGVFGNPEATGKPAGDDLREGKQTVLIAHTLDRCDALERCAVLESLGRADLSDSGIGQLRTIIADSGAVSAVEQEITALADRAGAAVLAAPGLDPVAAGALSDLISLTTSRDT